MNVKPISAYAVVKKKNPKINIFDIYSDKEIEIDKSEKIIKITITICLKK